MNEFISISSNSCITGIGWTCKTIRTSIIPRVITSFAAVSHVLPPVLSSRAYKFCLQSKYLYFDQSYRKKYEHSQCKINWLERNLICEAKRNKGCTKSLSCFLAFLYIAIKHTSPTIHREHSKQLMIMHLSDSHVRANIYFTTKE